MVSSCFACFAFLFVGFALLMIAVHESVILYLENYRNFQNCCSPRQIENYFGLVQQRVRGICLFP